ncbi:MAG: hypothetical protein MHM6MM_004625 [Cercozoa sp. M6MM]
MKFAAFAVTAAVSAAAVLPLSYNRCASQCQSALAANALHLCPKWCTGISTKPSLALSVLEADEDTANANAQVSGNLDDGAVCVFNKIFEAIGDDFAVAGGTNVEHAEHSALLGFRMPIVKKATKVHASLRIGVDGLVQSTDKAHLRIASVSDKNLTPLFRDLAEYDPTVPGFLVDNCHSTGRAVGELLSNGLDFRVSDLVTTNTNVQQHAARADHHGGR